MTHSVTRVRERSRGRVDVDLDGTPWRVLPADVVVRCGLRVGRQLDRETARLLARELRRARALGRATRALAARDRTRHELDDRLAGAGVPTAVREEAIDALSRAGLVDEERLARARVDALARRGYGDSAIEADLVRRGLQRETIAEAVSQLEPETRRARKLVDADGLTPRMVRRLSARGFSRETLDDLGAFGHEA